MNINDINSSDSTSSLNLLESEEQNNFINNNTKINETETSDKKNNLKKYKENIESDEDENNDNGNGNDKQSKIINETDKQNIRDELLKQKAYYKLLLGDYKKFIKKINYRSANIELSYDTTVISVMSVISVVSTMSKKTIDKSKNYNMKDTCENLYKNIKNIKKDLYYIFDNFNDKILVLDGENILKSYKYQQLIKLHLTLDQYNYYFDYWYNGSDNGLIQPMTSLNLSINDKLYLIDLIVKNYLNLFNCIIILSGKSTVD